MDGNERYLEEFYRSVRIVDTKAKAEQFVIHQGSLILCFFGATNRTLPHPNLSNLVFIGKAEIDYRVVNLWIERDANARDIGRIYSRADNGQVVRIDHSDPLLGRALSIHFHEFDAGTQSPSLFILPPEIISICNERPSPKLY